MCGLSVGNARAEEGVKNSEYNGMAGARIVTNGSDAMHTPVHFIQLSKLHATSMVLVLNTEINRRTTRAHPSPLP